MQAEIGTCALCGQTMVRDGDDAWHPFDVDRACPHEPERHDWSPAGWPGWYEVGWSPGRPGVEFFRRNDDVGVE